MIYYVVLWCSLYGGNRFKKTYVPSEKILTKSIKAGCMQAWYYYRKYRSRGEWKVKCLVGSISCTVYTVAQITYLGRNYHVP